LGAATSRNGWFRLRTSGKDSIEFLQRLSGIAA
jgi:hypothetical protein